MPSISNCSSAMAMDSANKTSLINAILLRAWRERWDDAQWGTYIKSVCNHSSIRQNTKSIDTFVPILGASKGCVW